MTNICGAGYVRGTVLCAGNIQMNKQEFCTGHSQFGMGQICKRVSVSEYPGCHALVVDGGGGRRVFLAITESHTEEATLKLSHKNDQKLAVHRWRAGAI